MINFFRKIRQNLLSQDEPSEVLPEQNQSEALMERTAKRVGRVSKYLKYSLGEIVLVVIGILIALQINNWNEHRKNVSLAKSYLSDIRKDLISDSLTFDTAMKRINRTIEKNKLLLNSDFANTVCADTIIYFLNTYFHSTRIYHIDNSTYLKLSNTGFLEEGLFNSVFSEISTYYNKEYVIYSEFIEWDKEETYDLYHPDFLLMYNNIDLPSLMPENNFIANIEKEKSSILALTTFIVSTPFRNYVWANYNSKKAVLDRILIQNDLATDLIEKIDIVLKS